MNLRTLAKRPTVPNQMAKGTFALADSGAITMYRPAQTTKPAKFLEAIGRRVRTFDGPFVPSSRTTQQGTSAASASTYYQSLWPQRFEKAFYIADCFQLYFTDSACYKACNMYVNEAIRGGVKIRVSGNDALSKRCQDIADDYIKRLWTYEALFENGIAQIVGGDLYLQAACVDVPLRGIPTNGSIDHFLTLPAAGMERCTDDADQFIDPAKAFSQVDTQTWGDVAYFPLWQVCHTRWNHVAGEKYGVPEILSARKLGRMVELLESAKVLQNQARSSMRLHWKFGTPENPASPQEVQDLMALNGYVQGKIEPLNPNEGLRNFFTNSVSEIVPIEGDAHIHQIDHIKYMLDRYANGLPTPRVLMNLGAENINRDVLKDIKAQWMADTVRLNKALEKHIKTFFELSLMLQNIDPKLIKYECVWTKSTIMSEFEQMQMIIEAVEARLISRQWGAQMAQMITNVPDIDEDRKQIEKESKADTDLEMKKRSAGSTLTDKMQDEGFRSSGKNNGARPVRK